MSVELLNDLLFQLCNDLNDELSPKQLLRVKNEYEPPEDEAAERGLQSLEKRTALLHDLCNLVRKYQELPPWPPLAEMLAATQGVDEGGDLRSWEKGFDDSRAGRPYDVGGVSDPLGYRRGYAEGLAVAKARGE